MTESRGLCSDCLRNELMSSSIVGVRYCSIAAGMPPGKTLLSQGDVASPLGVGQLYPVGYSPAPLLPQWGWDLIVLGYAQRGNGSLQRSGGGHTSIASHGYCGCSKASYGSRYPVGQQPGSTKVEGRCQPSGWRLPQPWEFTGPMGVPVNPGGGLTPEREGRDPVRREIPVREMPIWSGRAGWLRGPALSPLP